jgi:pimeloyl-ACP methyl ester carboxylesterase
LAKRIVFIHGAWVTPHCWDAMRPWFEAKGYDCLAPAWPGKDRSVAGINADPAPLKGLGIAEIVASYEQVIRGLDDPPILIGHSFGGLFTQILLDRGLGAAGVAIDPAPPKGVIAYEPSAYRSLLGVVINPLNSRKVVRWKYGNFRYAFVHTLSEADAHAAYDTQVTPETGRIFFQDALAALSPRSPARVNFANRSRPPLLVIGGSEDRIVPAPLVKRTVRKYAKAGMPVEYEEFAGRTHWLIAQDGWQEIAQSIEAFLERAGVAK